MTFTANNPNGYLLRGYPDSEVRIAAFDGPGDWPVVGWYSTGEPLSWVSSGWTASGSCWSTTGVPHSYDLIDKPAPKHVVRMYGYAWATSPNRVDQGISTYDSEAEAGIGFRQDIKDGYKCSPVELFEREVEGP